LERELVNEEVHENDVSFSSSWVGAGYRGPSVCGDKGGIDVVQDVGPNFTDIMDLGQGFEARVAKGVYSTFVNTTSTGLLMERSDGKNLRRGRVRVRANTSWVVNNVLSQDEVRNSGRCLRVPAGYACQKPSSLARLNKRNKLGHGIGPTLTHTTRFDSLQATTSSSASHSVSHTVSHLVNDKIVFERTITLGLPIVE